MFAMQGGLAIPSIGLILTAFALFGCDGAAPLPAEPPMNTVSVDRPAGELEGAPDEPVSRYANTRYGFSIAVPDGWSEFQTATNEEGSIFENKASDADLRVFASANEGDVEFQQAIEALREGTKDVQGRMIDENEYRGAATDAEGYRIQLRLVRAPDRMITAVIRYPARSAADFDAVAAVTLDSLALGAGS